MCRNIDLRAEKAVHGHRRRATTRRGGYAPERREEVNARRCLAQMCKKVSQKKTHPRRTFVSITFYKERSDTKTGACVPETILTYRPAKTGGRQLTVIQKDVEFKVQ